jgi:hypothetical protein
MILPPLAFPVWFNDAISPLSTVELLPLSAVRTVRSYKGWLQTSLSIHQCLFWDSSSWWLTEVTGLDSLWISGVNLIKHFWCKFTHTFCKLDRFIKANNHCLSAVKRSSLLRKVRKFMLKRFYEIDSRGLYYKTFYASNCCRIVIS